MELEILRKIGLSDGEIKVYSALLGQVASPINKIHEKTGIERRNIYDIINKLIEKGLVTYITENKRRLFKVSHPNKIIGYIDEKRQEIEKTRKEIEPEVHALTKRFNLVKPGINAEIFRGAEGVKAAWEEMLNYKTNCWIGSGRYIPKKFPAWFANWNKRRIKQKVWWYNLLRDDLRKETRRPFPFEKIKFLPKEFSGNPTVTGVYGNKVANFLFGKELFAFVIESKDLAENYRRYHNYLWDNVAKE